MTTDQFNSMIEALKKVRPEIPQFTPSKLPSSITRVSTTTTAKGCGCSSSKK